MKNFLFGFLFITIVTGFARPKATEEDSIIGIWLNQEQTSKINIFKAANGSFAGKFYGKITWLKDPNEGGKPKVDKNNPASNKKNDPLLGLLILKDFTYDKEDKEWSGGTIYDPKNGKTYSCYMKLDGNNKLNVRGYVGVSIMGRTAIWTR